MRGAFFTNQQDHVVLRTGEWVKLEVVGVNSHDDEVTVDSNSNMIITLRATHLKPEHGLNVVSTLRQLQTPKVAQDGNVDIKFTLRVDRLRRQEIEVESRASDDQRGNLSLTPDSIVEKTMATRAVLYDDVTKYVQPWMTTSVDVLSELTSGATRSLIVSSSMM